MPFLQEKTNRNFSVSQVHKFLNFESQGSTLIAVVNSYASIEAFLAPDHLLNWQDRFPIPPENAVDPEAWLTSGVGPFPSATMLKDITPLETVRSLKWAQIKTLRDQKEFGTFTYQGRSFNSNAISVQRIMLAAQAAQIRVASGDEAVVDWTTAENEVVTFSSTEMVEMAQALNSHVNEVHQIAASLREQIYNPSMDTAEKIAAIHWPI